MSDVKRELQIVVRVKDEAINALGKLTAKTKAMAAELAGGSSKLKKSVDDITQKTKDAATQTAKEVDRIKTAWGQVSDKTKASASEIAQSTEKITGRLRDARGRFVKTGDAAKASGKESVDAFERITKSAEKFSSKLKQLISLYIALRAISFVKGLSEKMSEAAAAAQELNSRFAVVFDSLEGEAATFGEALAKGVGRGRQEVRAALADFGQFFESLGFGGQRALELSKLTTSLGIDLASFFDQQDAETMQLLRSGLIGNAEALDRFGARLTAAEVEQEVFRLGMARSSQEITVQQQVIARLSLLQEKWKNATGDAIRTAGSFQNQMKGLRGALGDLRVEFGTRLNDAILKGLDTAGGLDRVLGLARVFFGAVEAIAEVGVRVGAELAAKAADAITRLGGPDGVVQLIQKGADLAATWLEAAAARAAAVVASIAAQVAPILSTLKALLPDNPVQRIKEIQQELAKLDAREAEIERAALVNAGQLSQNQVGLLNQQFLKVLEQRAALTREIAELEAKYGEVIKTSLEADKASADAAERRAEAAKALADTYERLKNTPALPGATGQVQMGQAVVAETQASGLATVQSAAQEAATSLTAMQTAYTQAQQAFRQGASNQIADTIFRMGEGAKSASEAFRELGRSILYALVQQRLARGIEAFAGSAFNALFGAFNPPSSFPTTPSAKGNVIASGQVQAFAKGGILGGPIAFPVKNGVGVAGEAGPEAILPVKRLPSGDLGVQAEGGGRQVNLAINITAADSRSFVDLLASDAKGFADLVAAAFAKNSQLRGLVLGRV